MPGGTTDTVCYYFSSSLFPNSSSFTLSMFTHLQLHTEFSLMRGMARIKKAIHRAKELGMTSLAITDYGSMYGVFKFFIACKDADIKPIVGCEVYQAARDMKEQQHGDFGDAHSLVILAKTVVGYKNLIKIVSHGFLDGMHYQPRVDFDLLEKYKEGLVVMSGAPLTGLLGKLMRDDQITEAREVLKHYVKLFGSDFYMQLERHPDMPQLEELNQKLIKLAREFGVPLVATANVHYMEKDDANAHEVLLCIGSQRVIYEKDRPLTMVDTPDYYFKTPDEMNALFGDLPEAIENTAVIAEKCTVEIPHGKLILPIYPVPDGSTPEAYLRTLINERRVRAKDYDQEVVTQRLDYEEGIINAKGYAPYFLFVQDVVNWAKDHGIAVGPGRGSGAGSLIAYCLRITDINPLDYNLPFERFLNPERPTPPDFDVDFADTRREEVVKYISQRYGEEKVAQIITFGTMEARMVVRDVGRALGHSYATGDRISKMIPPSKQGFPVNLEIALEQAPALKLAYDGEEEVKSIIDVSMKLESLPRHASVHAAGLIVADRPIMDHIPVQREPKGDKIITQYDMYSLDLNAVSDNKAVGLVKADILGLRNLSIIESAMKFIEETKGERIDIHEVKLDNQKAYDLMSRGETVGVFQLESGGMRRLAKELQPNKLTDITAMVALYRPGPMDLIPTFIEGKRDPSSVTYPHPDLKVVLEETYGILVYQEQVIDIAVVMAHFSKSRADLLRMAVGKKKKSLMEKGRVEFIEGCVAHGYKKKLAEDVFGFIEKFASYGFNKSHAASYALIAYWTAYIKANYPVAFMASLLTAEINGASGPIRDEKVGAALEECKRMQILVLPPDIHKSSEGFTIEGESIRFGLAAIRNVGSAAIEEIVTARKAKEFSSFTDFLQRVDLRRVNKKTLESLIKVGAFASFANRATLIAAFPALVEQAQKSKESTSVGQFDMFGMDTALPSDSFRECVEYPEHEIAEFERELIGFLISSSPLTQYAKIISEKVTLKMKDISPTDIKKKHIVVGIVTAMKVVRTKKDNAEMIILTLNDGTGTLEMVCFPKTYQKIKSVFAPHIVLMVKGVIDKREDGYNMMIDNAIDLKRATSE